MNFLKRLLGSDINHLSAAEAEARIKGAQPPFLLDVRQPDEYKAGHISGAMLIPLNELGKRMNEIPADREVLCVCEAGGRSSTATRQLASAGYQSVNLRGGMAGWRGAGFAVKRGK